MGLMDMVEQLTGQAGGQQANPNAAVTGGLLEELQSRPGGVGGLLQAMHGNGMGSQVQQWSQGQTAPANPGQIQQGLSGTGMIESLSQRTGMSSGMVEGALAAALPFVIHHFVSNGHVDAQGQHTGPQPEMGGVLQSVLGRII